MDADERQEEWASFLYQRRRHQHRTKFDAIRTGAMALTMGIVSTGCGFALPPSPTNAEPPAGEGFEVAIDNQSSSAIRLVLAQETSGPSLMVGPCEASSLKYSIDGPFSLRVGAPQADDSALPILATSDELAGDDGIRVLVRIAPDGSVSFGDLVGSAPYRPPGEC